MRHLLFWICWPALWLLLHNTDRTRVLIRHKDTVLLVRGRLDHLFGDQTWGLPGGGKHRSEELAAAAARELHEEIRLAIAPQLLKSTGEDYIKNRGIGYRAHFFVVSITNQSKPKCQWLEIADAQWFPVDALIHMPLKPEVSHALGTSVGSSLV